MERKSKMSNFDERRAEEIENEKTLPIVFLTTSKNCGHCNKFRGNGNPSNDKEWSYPYIKKIMLDKDKNVIVSSLIEMNLFSNNNSKNNIAEVNIYTCVPSISEILNVLRKNSRNELLNSGKKIPINFNKYKGSDIERIKIYKSGDIYYLEAYVNGILSEELTQFYNDSYIWDHITEDRRQERNKILSGKNGNYQNIKDFEDKTKEQYDFEWVISKIIPEKIREYENYYPIWYLISQEEWKKGLTGKRIYLESPNNETVMIDGVYNLIRNSGSREDIFSLIKKYHSEEKIDIKPLTNNKKKYSWHQLLGI